MVYDIDTHALFLAFSFSLSFRTFRYRQFLFSKAQGAIEYHSNGDNASAWQSFDEKIESTSYLCRRLTRVSTYL